VSTKRDSVRFQSAGTVGERKIAGSSYIRLSSRICVVRATSRNRLRTLTTPDPTVFFSVYADESFPVRSFFIFGTEFIFRTYQHGPSLSTYYVYITDT